MIVSQPRRGHIPPADINRRSSLIAVRSADTMTLQVSSTRQSTLYDHSFLVAAARAWNSLPPETQACSSLLTFWRETKSHLFRQSYGWLCTLHSDRPQTSALSCATVLDINFVKSPCNCVMAALYTWNSLTSPWWSAALLCSTQHVNCYSHHTRTSVTVSGGVGMRQFMIRNHIFNIWHRTDSY